MQPSSAGRGGVNGLERPDRFIYRDLSWSESVLPLRHAEARFPTIFFSYPTLSYFLVYATST